MQQRWILIAEPFLIQQVIGMADKGPVDFCWRAAAAAAAAVLGGVLRSLLGILAHQGTLGSI